MAGGYILALLVLLVGGIYFLGKKTATSESKQQSAEVAADELKNDQKIDADLRAMSLELARKRMRDKIK